MDIGYQGYILALDLDDTLYSERDFVISGYRSVAQAIEPISESKQFKLFSTMVKAFDSGRNPFETIVTELKDYQNRRQSIPKWVLVYREHMPDIALAEDAKNFLDTAQSKGVRLALITDGRSKTQRNKINALGLNRYIANDNIIISEEVGGDKLTPLPFSRLVDNYPNASRFIYIADNPKKDFYFPNLLGWTTICLADSGNNIHTQDIITDKLHYAQHVIHSLCEFFSLSFSHT